MTEPEHTVGPGHEGDLEEALHRERAAKEDLESRVIELERQLNTERAKFERVRSRTSVRLALRLAALARPLVEVFRRRRPAINPRSKASLQPQITSAIRAHRTDPGPETGPLVTIVVLNRNGARHLSTLLPALRDNTTYRSFEVLVVDNGSTDESIDLLSEDWGFPLQVIRNSENVSFSRGCNQGIARATGSYVLLLNNDIAPINSGWLGAMVASLEEDSHRGAAGTLLVYPERPGYLSKDHNTGADLTVQHRGIRYRWRRNAEPSATVPWAYNMGVGEDPTRAALAATVEVPAATAACLLVRSDLLDQLGGLDEGFMYGMEDVDLCLRIRAAGFSIVVVGGAGLFHHEFGTQSAMAAAQKRANGLANLRHFSQKWGPQLSRLLQLESLLPETQRLRHRPPPVVAITTTRDDTGVNGNGGAADELGEALTSAGYSVVYTDRHEDEWYEVPSDVVTIVSLQPDYDVRKAPPDTTTIAWVLGRTEHWIEQPWFGEHDIYVPGSEPSAAILTAAGITVAEIVPPDSGQLQQITAVARDFILRPRIALKVGATLGDGAATGAEGRLEGLADSLRRRGAVTQIHPPDDWQTPAAQCVDVVIQIEVVGHHSPNPAHKSILWIVDPGQQVSPDICDGYDLVLVASGAQAEELRPQLAVPVEVTGQWTKAPAGPEALAKRLMELVDELGWEPLTRLQAP